MSDMTFYQFIERLQGAGWEGSGDAQWAGAKLLYDELFLPPPPVVPTVSPDVLRQTLPKLVLWGMVTEEIIATQRAAFVTGYREGLGDGLLSKDGSEDLRAAKFSDDLRVLAATVAASNGRGPG